MSKNEQQIQKAFEEMANEMGFVMDVYWDDRTNPYCNEDTHLAYTIFRNGWLARGNQ
ncbi:hypothetical protein [Acinetobacter ursingii]|uniref:hypothetical protein n=1 Tax=Acinetobacter ursingii TaxID=108980 RepID=UPI0021CD5C98|nr:hypothetical protein [Acinetobacter ursingii]MCU4481254.1 hypothetical protein [Acinetobacter ursingii]MCU4505583.1 hypothetical protein [Acinetobacter ursingii]MCU4571051.1 hypothetical protein [Acinetobacter ursingii]